MAESIFDAMAFLRRLKDLKKVQWGKWDGRPIDILDCKVEVGPPLKIVCRFSDAGQEHTVDAEHPWIQHHSQPPDVIRVDGKDVDKDDMDLQFASTLFRVDMKYLLDYQQDGQPHWFVLRARARTLNV